MCWHELLLLVAGNVLANFHRAALLADDFATRTLIWVNCEVRAYSAHVLSQYLEIYLSTN